MAIAIVAEAFATVAMTSAIVAEAFAIVAMTSATVAKAFAIVAMTFATVAGAFATVAMTSATVAGALTTVAISSAIKEIRNAYVAGGFVLLRKRLQKLYYKWQYKKYNAVDCPNDNTKCIIANGWKSIDDFLD